MTYSKPFFDLQVHFALRVAALSGMPLARALLDCTNLYIRFGLGRAFDAADPTWQAYLAGVESAPDPTAWTDDFYRARLQHDRPPSAVATIGCFSYARLSASRLRIHFRDTDASGHSPLAPDRRGHRLEELRALSELIHRNEHPSVRMVGASWLYNLEAYRRLFPPAYLATATTAGARFRHLPLWGQFLDRHGAVRQSVAAPFLHRLSSQSSLQGLDRCFPFQVLALEAPTAAFHAFYGQ